MEPTDRFEYKFLLTSAQHETIFAALKPTLQADILGSATGSYPVVSLYYDTPDLLCYWSSQNRLPQRRKLRIRIYGSADGSIPETSFVEIKSKIEGRSLKYRVQTPLANALAILSGQDALPGFSQPAQQILELVHEMVHVEQFRPTCIIRYQRDAYALTETAPSPHPGESRPAPAEPLRVTFDSQIRYRFTHLVPQPDDTNFTAWLIPGEQQIMEVKGIGKPPLWLTNFLESQQITPMSLSKYSTAVGLNLSS